MMASKSPEQLDPQQHGPESLNNVPDACSFEATVEAMRLDDAPGAAMVIDEPGDDVHGMDTVKPVVHDFGADKENVAAQRGGLATQSVDLQGDLRHIPPQNLSCDDNTHP